MSLDSDKKQISILGCGWLGTPLATALIQKGFSVNGSTTSENKIPILKNLDIFPYLITLSENGIDGNIADFLKNSALLIIDIPPKLRGENKESFVAKIEHLIPYIENSAVKCVIFISSTSVYGDKNAVVTEETNPNPETESGRQLVVSENMLQKNTKFQTTVLRFGGLIGGDRHPGKYLAGKKNLDNPTGPINLIHQVDCIGIIIKIIELGVWNEIFNAVAPDHPTREEYYIAKAILNNLPLPSFNHSNASVGKIVDSTKLLEKLNYHFTHKLI